MTKAGWLVAIKGKGKILTLFPVAIERPPSHHKVPLNRRGMFKQPYSRVNYYMQTYSKVNYYMQTCSKVNYPNWDILQFEDFHPWSSEYPLPTEFNQNIHVHEHELRYAYDLGTCSSFAAFSGSEQRKLTIDSWISYYHSFSFGM